MSNKDSTVANANFAFVIEFRIGVDMVLFTLLDDIFYDLIN
jgi:hypothetical protein